MIRKVLFVLFLVALLIIGKRPPATAELLRVPEGFGGPAVVLVLEEELR